MFWKKNFINHLRKKSTTRTELLTTHTFLDEFPALWDSFEEAFHRDALELFAQDKDYAQLSSLYQHIAFNIWWKKEGLSWHQRVEEIFFDSEHNSTLSLLLFYPKLDELVSEKREALTVQNPQEIYRQAVKPILDARKQELIETFQIWAVEMKEPFPYEFTIHIGKEPLCLDLRFQKRYRKRDKGGMDGYVYTLNERSYQDVQAFSAPITEVLDKDTGIAVDQYGEKFLRNYTSIPTFDSGDREWDSHIIEYLMFDGQNINLVKMQGGYYIATLTFYEKLLTANQASKPLLERLGWPLDGIEWT